MAHLEKEILAGKKFKPGELKKEAREELGEFNELKKKVASKMGASCKHRHGSRQGLCKQCE